MTADPHRDWQRTSPTAVIFFIGRILRNVLTHGLPALAPLVVTFATVESLRLYWLALGLLPIAAGVLLWSVLSYLRFQFRLDDRLILLRRGVLHHERLTIEFKRVQNVSIQEPFYMRPLGLVVLSIDTAGSQSTEITLGGIRNELAQSLRAAILADADGKRAASEGESTDEPQPVARLLVERTPRQIARYGLTASGLFWVAIAFGFVAGLGGGRWFATAMKELVEYLVRLVQEGGVLYLVGIIAVVVAGVLSLPLLSMAGALIRHYGYRLTREGDTYRRRSGLINRHEEALKQHKIQSVLWKQNAIARAMGMVTLKLEVAGSGEEETNPSGIPVGMLSPFLVPALDSDEALELTREFLPECIAESIEFSRPNARRYIGRKLLLIFTAPILVVSLPPAIFLHWVFLLLIPIAYGVAFLFLRQLWSRWGYAVRGGYGFVRSGFLGFSTAVFPLFKMQRVDLRQTPGQRRARLAHLTLHLASGSMTIPHIRLDDAQRLRDLALHGAESTRRAWY
ncbi:MAG: PH domain-containing protein [bacterium]|nr:PH domain-containing protein [bacterium]